MLEKVSSSVIVIVVFFILLFLYSKFAPPIPLYINSVSTNKTDTFNVIGQGNVSVKPDTAVARVGVGTNAQTVAQAQEQLNSAINKVTQAVKKLGITEKDIQTENYSIYPNTDF